MRITLKDVEENIKPLGNKLSYDREFIFDLLGAFGRASGNITRLRNGQLNVADSPETEVAQKNVVYFKATTDSSKLYVIIDDLKTSPTVVRYNTRFVIVTDYHHLLAIDLKTGESLDIDIREINRHYTFFLPWAGMEKAQFIAENHADVKAAEKMAKLFDILIAHNGYRTADEWHTLTTFFTRLLFCFFAEDTNIFKKNQFINAITSYTQEDGSDLKDFLKILFASLDDKDKDGYPAYLAAFPYVNGQLFRDFTDIPDFNKEARTLLIDSSSKLDWSDINPDIFGSMFQAVVRPGERTGLGQHYTSVPNITKTIEPLFLNDLKDEFDSSFDDAKKLDKLLVRISGIRIFDPACGSGNFLIIAYKELRRLEHAILERQGELSSSGVQQALLGSRINIENFYGIEIDDFAHEVAILSLWLAKHQMNIEFAQKFGIELPLIPLKESGNIAKGNATRLNWSEVCPNNGNDEIYIIGNPPYAGSKYQTQAQKNDYPYVFDESESFSKNLDYIALWFIKGARYISGTNAQLAYVTTNSVSQGEHVALMFPKIFEQGLEIGFAFTSFEWSNNAKHNAGVTVAVIGLRNKSDKQKYIWADGIRTSADNINGYLANADNIIIERKAKPISDLPDMVFGSMPRDGGYLILSTKERKQIIDEYPEASQFIKKFFGAAEYIKGQVRYCIWVSEEDYELAKTIPPIRKRFEEVANNRSGSDAKSTRDYANRPYRFVQISYSPKQSIILPKTTSNSREYIPMGFVDKDTVVSDLSFAIYDAELWVLGLLTSKMHMAWVKTVAGRLRVGFRYSNTIVYNNFPVPPLRTEEKSAIEEKVLSILDVRENHAEKTLAEMYDSKKMPDDLRLAHQELDELVDNIYRKKVFENDEDRINHLFELYEIMISRERQ
jgi:hypothetical protein